MTRQAIRAAMFQALADFDGAMPTAYPNTAFNKPEGVYQEAHVLFARPDNVEISDKHYFQRGYMQVTYHWPNNTGTGSADAKNDALTEAFHFGRTIPYSVDRAVRIIETPEAMAPFNEADRFVNVVRIPFEAQVKRG